jgi:hypothetical protein
LKYSFGATWPALFLSYFARDASLGQKVRACA